MSAVLRCSVRCFLFLLCCFVVFVSAEEKDLYKILGVARSASAQEIKKAYRKKALDTHPDKNKDVPAEEAAAAFQKVVHAFEILSDASSRRRYDQSGRTDGGGSRHQGHQGSGYGSRRGFYFNRRQRPKPKLKERFDVQQSQSRVIHLASLDQLEVIITNDEVLERNLIICFYTPPLEKHLMEEMVYPWPFAAMSAQRIWWEDILQTTAVRFHRSNELTEFFGIPKGDDMKKPIFLFGKKGEVFRDPLTWKQRLITDKREEFDEWVWKQLQRKVTFVNKHNHSVEIYWVHDNKARHKGYIHANDSVEITTNLSHEWWMRDARTDTRKDSPGRHKLSQQSCLYNVKITSDTRTVYTIPKRSCYDLSGHCAYWNDRKACSRNPDFMHKYCAVTCGRCKQHDFMDRGESENATKFDTRNTEDDDEGEERKSSIQDEL